jgi:hypothetical protein
LLMSSPPPPPPKIKPQTVKSLCLWLTPPQQTNHTQSQVSLSAAHRSSAISFSMCFLCSSSVVAPMHCSCPRASAGFVRLLL